MKWRELNLYTNNDKRPDVVVLVLIGIVQKDETKSEKEKK